MDKKQLAKLTSAIHSNNDGLILLLNGASKTETVAILEIVTREFDTEQNHINLSRFKTKYIGETEKNIERIFKQAEKDNWVLFFDEADALFGKRTEIKDSHDRFSNTEINFLLSRLEKFKGLSILTTNNKQRIESINIDKKIHEIHFLKYLTSGDWV